MIILTQRAQAMIAETGPRIQDHLDLRRVITSLDLAEHHRAIDRAGEGERLAALDNAILGDPAAPPDQAALLVIAAQTNWLVGVTAYTPAPPMSEANTPPESQRGAHIQTMSPRGPMSAPRSPSAISA